MTGRIPGNVGRLCAAILAVAAVSAVAAAGASAEVIYDNIPSPLPGNFASYGNQAYSTSEFGGEVEFAGAARRSPTVTVVMSSWACQRGNWYEHTCESGLPMMKHFFKEPITFKVYEVGPGNTVGAKIAQRTKSFKMPYRPSDSTKCVEGRWYDEASATCFHGKAFAISLKLRPAVRTLPSKAIVSVSYNTSTHGPSPYGTGTACFTTTAGCPYDSLNVAVSEPAENTLSLGSQPTEELFVNSTYNEMYCGSSATLGTFGPSGVCPAWYGGAQPVVRVSAN
jgi:hypothetical protein